MDSGDLGADGVKGSLRTKSRRSRRSFLSQALTAWTGLTLAPLIYAAVEYIIPVRFRESVLQAFRVAAVADLPENDARIIRIDKKAIAVVKMPGGQVKAFSAVCTHLGCIVQYQSDRKLFHCNCHGSEFDLTGKNVAGPAPVPLHPYRVEIRNTDIFVSQG